MNTPNVPDFGPAYETISWAKSDFLELNTKIASFFTSENTKVITEQKPEGVILYKLKVSDPIPFADFKKPAVGTLMNVRHSFDQAVNIAASHITGKRFKGNFPWSGSLADLHEHRIKKFPEQLWDSIKTQEPYPKGGGYSGGNDLIRSLAKLANNKHSIGFQVLANGGIHTQESVRTGGGIKKAIFFGPNWDFVKQEAALYAQKGGYINFGKNTKFGLRICFEIPELTHPPDVLFSLHEFLFAAMRNLKCMESACTK